MWTSIKLDSQVNSTLREIQLQVEKHLIDCPDTPLPPRLAQYTDRKSILDAWVTRQEAWNIAVKGRSTTDLFFVLLCNAYAVTRLDRLREISETANGAMILKQLKLHAATLTDQKPSIADTQELFEQCAAVVVWTLEHCAQDTLDTTIAFGLDFGDPNDVYKGKDETKVMQQDDDDGKGDKYADELKKSQQEDEQLKVARDFLPWCSRFFFEHWFEQQLFKQFPVDEKFDWFKVNQARPKFDHWITKQLKTSLPKAYENRLKVWIYRMLLGVGSMSMYMRDPMRQGRRAPDLDDVFLAQETQTTLPYEKWVSDSDNSKMLQTPAADIAILAAYVTVFDASIQGMNFDKEFLVLRDELHSKRQLIEQDSDEFGRARRPLIVQFATGWAVHDRKFWIPCKNVSDALVLWCHLVATRYGKRLLQAAEINVWLALFTV